MLLLAIVSTPALIFAMLYGWARNNPSLATDNHPAEYYGRAYPEY